MAKEVLHAWFSLKATKHGCNIYKDADGNDVYATLITTTPEYDKEKYRWDDVVYRGTVIECVKILPADEPINANKYAAKRGRESFGWVWS